MIHGLYESQQSSNHTFYLRRKSTMKKLRLLVLVLAIGMIFTSCSTKDKNNTSSNPTGSGVVSDIVSGGKDIVSGIESGSEKVVSGIESGVESMIPGDRDHDNSTENSRIASENASNDASLDAAANANINKSQIDFSSISSLSQEKHGWGQGVDVDNDNRPISCTQFQDKYGILNAHFIEENDKNIYLTFDEGYENGYTAQILDILKEKKCPAVFFVTMPYVKENPDLIKRMIDEGHTVGNHSVNHPSMPTVGLEQAVEEITQLHDYVKEEFQYNMTLFRPPMGEWSEQTLALTKQLGYQSLFWSFAYKDWETDNQPDPTTSLEKITKAVHPGAIYLLHAVSSTNTAILGDFIDQVRNQGYVFASYEKA